MNNLSSSERKYLRSQAHHLEPVVLIGKNGIKDGTIESINKVLMDIRPPFEVSDEFKDEKLKLSGKIAELTNSEIVGIIGHTLILFRQNPDSEKQQIHFPAKK